MTYKLFSVESDAKTVKGNKRGYLTAVLYLAPAGEAGGRTMCPYSSPECEDACLNWAGRAGIFKAGEDTNAIQQARIRRTLAYLADPQAFEDMLASDIDKLVREAASRDLIPAVRVNGTSDQPKLAQRLARRYPSVQFYDYTKIPQPWRRTLPNYHLTFSFSGNNHLACYEALMYGINVAVVFDDKVPETWQGTRVINGDESDLRFLDARGVIVGLKSKGVARKMAVGGFIQIGAVA